MKIAFENPVEFSTIHLAFTGEGIPSIPEDAVTVKVSDRTVAYISPRGEAWEVFSGSGTSLESQTYFWPTLGMCPRWWAENLRPPAP